MQKKKKTEREQKGKKEKRDVRPSNYKNNNKGNGKNISEQEKIWDK